MLEVHDFNREDAWYIVTIQLPYSFYQSNQIPNLVSNQSISS